MKNKSPNHKEIKNENQLRHLQNIPHHNNLAVLDIWHSKIPFVSLPFF